MPTAIARQTVTTGTTATPTPDATETVRGTVSVVPRTKLVMLLDRLRDTGIADALQTNEAVSLAMLGEAMEYLLEQPMAVKAKWEFPQGMKLGLQPNLLLKTNGLGDISGTEQLQVSDVQYAAIDFPSVNLRGTFALSAANAPLPSPLSANAIGAVQVGNGSGAGSAIVRGDGWSVTVAGTLAGGIPVLVETLIVALLDNPGQDIIKWGIADKEAAVAAANAADPKLQQDLFLSGRLAGNNGLSSLGWGAGGTERHRRGSEGQGITAVTAAAQYSGMYLYAENTAAKSKISLTEKWRFVVRIETPTQIFANIGITATAGGYTPNNGLFFVHEANEPFWRISNRGAADTETTTTIPFNGLCAEFEINTATPGSVQYYINGILAGTTNTNIPLATQDFYPFISIAPNEAVEKRLTLYEYSRTLK